MSKECDFCGKKPQVGNLVSHSNIKTKRRFNPNLLFDHTNKKLQQATITLKKNGGISSSKN